MLKGQLATYVKSFEAMLPSISFQKACYIPNYDVFYIHRNFEGHYLAINDQKIHERFNNKLVQCQTYDLKLA